MRRIAITGGIGSGKSYVCHLLEKRGISVYDSDAAAKRLYHTDKELQESLKRLVGNDVYQGDVLQKRILAEFLLSSEANKEALNNVIHPAVARDFLRSGKHWLESAILFDSGFHRRVRFDHIICVTAPLETRINRIIKRDGISQAKALEWIKSQWAQEEVARRSDFVITNDGEKDIDAQIDKTLNSLQII